MHLKLFFTLSLLSCSSLFSTLSFAETTPSEFTSQAKVFMEGLIELSTMSKLSKGSSTSESEQKIKALSEKIDFNNLAKTSLGAKRWSSFPSSDRMAFMAALQEILEVLGYPNAKKFSTSQNNLVYELVPKFTNRVRVSGRVEREKKGEIIQEDVEVTLVFEAKSKRVIDAVLLGELLSTNLKRQFDAALKTKTFKDIIAQMKKRVTEAKSNAQK